MLDKQVNSLANSVNGSSCCVFLGWQRLSTEEFLAFLSPDNVPNVFAWIPWAVVHVAYVFVSCNENNMHEVTCIIIFMSAATFSTAKARRQPKPAKPKKMIKLEGKVISHVACNSGTSAMVTKQGELFMFGKDTIHCDHASGKFRCCNIVLFVLLYMTTTYQY